MRLLFGLIHINEPKGESPVPKTGTITHPDGMCVASGEGVGAKDSITGVPTPYLDQILEDLLTEFITISPTDPLRLRAFYENMGGFLAQVTDEDQCSRWTLRFVIAVASKYPDIPMTLCAWTVQYWIAQAMNEVQR